MCISVKLNKKLNSIIITPTNIIVIFMISTMILNLRNMFKFLINHIWKFSNQQLWVVLCFVFYFTKIFRAVVYVVTIPTCILCIIWMICLSSYATLELYSISVFMYALQNVIYPGLFILSVSFTSMISVSWSTLFF